MVDTTFLCISEVTFKAFFMFDLVQAERENTSKYFYNWPTYYQSI